MDHAAALQQARGIGRDAIPGLGSPRLLSRAAQRRLRVHPWRGDPSCALLGPARGAPRPTVDDVLRAIDELDRQEIGSVVTPAMNRFEAEVFYQAGFRHHEMLHLLMRRLHPRSESTSANPHDGLKIKTGYRWHLGDMLDVDARAFSGFWRFDRVALNLARTATPSQRSRLATIDGKVAGYAVTGRSGGRGYLQRLAVDPRVEGRGIGTALIADTFDWLARRGASSCLVNTQDTNHRALRLYEHVGFERQPEGLVVLTWDRVT